MISVLQFNYSFIAYHHNVLPLYSRIILIMIMSLLLACLLDAHLLCLICFSWLNTLLLGKFCFVYFVLAWLLQDAKPFIVLFLVILFVLEMLISEPLWSEERKAKAIHRGEETRKHQRNTTNVCKLLP